MAAIYILWLRQLKRYFRARARVIGSLGQPILFLVGLGFGMGNTFKQAGRGDYIQFLSPGIIAMGILFTGLFSGIEILWDRQFGFLKETLVAPVPRLYIVVGRTLGGATIALVQGLLVFIACVVAGFRIENYAAIPLAFVFMALIAVSFTAVGTVFGSVLEDMQAFPVIMNFLVMPLFFFSGAIFPLDGLPKALVVTTRINPLSYGVDGLRGALTHGYAFGLWPDLLVLAVVTAALSALGSWFFARIQL